jgi:hypothetical protein
MLKGHCFCGAVQIEVEDAFEYAAYCHCSRCRRRTGSAFTAFGGIATEKLRVTVGADQLALINESAEGYYCLCRQCLSPLFALTRQRKYVHVQLGVLSDAPSRRPDHHIQVASKAPWHDITDDLPQYAEFPG